LFQGWYGGEMVFLQGVGVAAADQGTEQIAKAQHRLAAVSHMLTGRMFETQAIGASARSQTGGQNSDQRP